MKGEVNLLKRAVCAPPAMQIPEPETEDILCMYNHTRTFKGYTAEILENDILEVTVFDSGGMAEYRIFLAELDYVSQINPGADEQRRSSAKPFKIFRFCDTYYWNRGYDVFMADEKDAAEAVRWLRKHNALKDSDVFMCIALYAETIGKHKLEKKHERIRKSVDEAMLQIRPVPKDFEKWADRVPFVHNRYIMYEYSRKKVTVGYCTHCSQRVAVSGAKHQKKGVCPGCGSEVTYLASGKTTDFTIDKQLIYIQKGKDGETIFRFFNARRRFWNNGLGELKLFQTINETEREFYLAKQTYEYYGGQWVKRYSAHIETRGFIYGGNIKRLFKPMTEERSHLKYIPFDRLMKKLMPVTAHGFWETCIDYPQLEYLAKLRFYRMCAELMEDCCPELRSCNIISEYHLKKADVEYIQIHDIGASELELYINCKKHDISIFPEMRKLSRAHCGATIEQIFYLMKYMSFEKIKEYAREQTALYRHSPNRYTAYTSDAGLISYIISDWRDYIENCTALKWNLRDTRVLKPKNLIERHDTAAELIKLQQSAADAEKIKELYYKYMFELWYNNGEYTVIPPKSILDIKYEGEELHHCVYTNYARRAAEEKSIILFIRKNDEFYKPYLTLELNPKDYSKVQLRGLRNCSPDKEAAMFYREYERRVLNKLQKQGRAA